MKITLIYPGIAQIGFGSFGGGSPSTNLMNLGLGYLAASIKANSKHEVDLIDLRKLKGWDHFSRELGERSCDVVGIYTNTVNFEFAMKCAEISRAQGKRVIAGGPHATIAPEELLERGHVQHVITGEAEHTILEVLERLERGLSVERVTQGTLIEDLDSLPFPDRDLFDMDGALKLSGIFPFPSRYVGVLASRGCYFNCAFCQPLEKKLFGKKIKFRSIDNVMREVRLLRERYRANFIMFQDDQLTQNGEWFEALCAGLKDLKILWGALARVDTISEPIARKMKEAGCVVVQFGFESGSQRILDFLRKKAKVGQALTAARLCRDHGLLIFANYMLGIPTETAEDLEATYRLMKEINPEIHAGSYFSPIPGCDLFDYCRENGLIGVSSYDMYVRGAVDNKVKGVDYRLVGEIKKRIERCTPRWYREQHYASCVLRRWGGLLKHGHYLQAAKEFVTQTPILDRSLGTVYHRMRAESA